MSPGWRPSVAQCGSALLAGYNGTFSLKTRLLALQEALSVGEERERGDGRIGRVSHGPGG